MDKTYTVVPLEVDQLRVRYRHLVWSNPQAASTESLLGAALLRSRFLELLDFAQVFGLDALVQSWERLRRNEPNLARSRARSVERILNHLQLAALRAQTSNPDSVGAAAA